MHARELVELAAIVAAQGPALIATPGCLPAGAIDQYWLASKCRLDRWNRALSQFRDGRRASAGVPASWSELRPILEEILISDILTRVWTGVLCAFDRQRNAHEIESVARSVWLGHVESRHRVMCLLVSDVEIEPAEAVALNRLRRRTERWSDLLLGYLLEQHDVIEFAVCHETAREFASDLRSRRHQPGGEHAWPLTLAALRGAFQTGLSEAQPNGDAHARVAASILACLPPELFDGLGLARSLWLTRLSTTASDVAGLIADWFDVDGQSAGERATPSWSEFGVRTRRPS